MKLECYQGKPNRVKNLPAPDIFKLTFNQSDYKKADPVQMKNLIRLWNNGNSIANRLLFLAHLAKACEDYDQLAAKPKIIITGT